MTGKSRKPGTKCLEDILETDDTSFISFIEVSLKIFLVTFLTYSNVCNGTLRRE